jgi:hypothetical protein
MPKQPNDPFPRTPCKGCGKPIVWATDIDGKRHPLDPTPPVYLVQMDGGNPVATRQPAAFVSHFATCPQRDRFSASKPKTVATEVDAGMAAERAAADRVADADPAAMLQPTFGMENRAPSMCGLCDGTYDHVHPQLVCLRCGVVGLAENMRGHVCVASYTKAEKQALREAVPPLPLDPDRVRETLNKASADLADGDLW